VEDVERGLALTVEYYGWLDAAVKNAATLDAR
jgi:hypothetical protein